MPRHLPSQAARQKGVSKVVWKLLSVKDKSFAVSSSVNLCLFAGVSFALSSTLHHCAGFELFGGRSKKGQRFFARVGRSEEGQQQNRPEPFSLLGLTCPVLGLILQSLAKRSKIQQSNHNCIDFL